MPFFHCLRQGCTRNMKRLIIENSLMSVSFYSVAFVFKNILKKVLILIYLLTKYIFKKHDNINHIRINLRNIFHLKTVLLTMIMIYSLIHALLRKMRDMTLV
jgi:hypothetical protein